MSLGSHESTPCKHKRPRLMPMDPSAADDEEFAGSTMPRHLGDIGAAPTEQAMVTFNATIQNRDYEHRVAAATRDPDGVEYTTAGTNQRCFNVLRHQLAFRRIPLRYDERSGTYGHAHKTPYARPEVFGPWNLKRFDEEYVCVGFFSSTLVITQGLQQFHMSPNNVAVNAQGVGKWFNGPQYVFAGEQLYVGPPIIAPSRTGGAATPHCDVKGLDPMTLLPTIRPVRPSEHGHPSNQLANLAKMIWTGKLIDTDMYKKRWALTLAGAVRAAKSEAFTPTDNDFKVAAKEDRRGCTADMIKAHVARLKKVIEENNAAGKRFNGIAAGDEAKRAAWYFKMELMKEAEDQHHYNFYGRIIGKALESAMPGQAFNILFQC